MQASYYSVNSTSFKSADSKYVAKQPVSDVENEWNNQHQPSESSIKLNEHYDRLQQQHLLYGVTGTISVSCCQQKIQMDSGEVYVVQDLYGMATQNAEVSSELAAGMYQCVFVSTFLFVILIFLFVCFSILSSANHFFSVVVSLSCVMLWCRGVSPLSIYTAMLSNRSRGQQPSGHRLPRVCDLPHRREGSGGVSLSTHVYVHYLCRGSAISRQQVPHVQTPGQHAAQVCVQYIGSMTRLPPVVLTACLYEYLFANNSLFLYVSYFVHI
jgi:hypothetical protein